MQSSTLIQSDTISMLVASATNNADSFRPVKEKWGKRQNCAPNSKWFLDKPVLCSRTAMIMRWVSLSLLLLIPSLSSSLFMPVIALRHCALLCTEKNVLKKGVESQALTIHEASS